jgi:hypothetical protein
MERSEIRGISVSAISTVPGLRFAPFELQNIKKGRDLHRALFAVRM